MRPAPRGYDGGVAEVGRGRGAAKRRIGRDATILPDLERLDEKLEGLDEVPPEAFAAEPRALRQALRKVWWKARKGRSR